jgi:hypothetical protein
VWACNGLTPLAAISQWMNYVQAEDPNNINGRGIGITFNFDPTYTCTSNCFYTQQTVYDSCEPIYSIGGVEGNNQPTRGKLVLWADAFANCRQSNDPYVANRIIGTYIVNGGNGSPVISFTPNIKWNFLASMRAGGASGLTNATQYPNIKTDSGPAMGTGADCGIGGTGQVKGKAVNSKNAVAGGQTVMASIEAQGSHMRANQLFTSVEAELKVQGDPDPNLCSPIFGYGRSISILVTNTFYLNDGPYVDSVTTGTGTTASVATFTTNPYGTVSGCPGWATLSHSSCNSPLTNRNWLIKGVDHQIKAGSYVTTYKIILLAPGGDIPAASPGNVALNLGGDSNSSLDFQDRGYQSTVACIDRWPNGSQYVESGDFVGTQCVAAPV